MLISIEINFLSSPYPKELLSFLRWLPESLAENLVFLHKANQLIPGVMLRQLSHEDAYAVMAQLCARVPVEVVMRPSPSL